MTIQQALQRRLRNPRTLRAGATLMLANLIVTGLGVVRTPAMTWMLPKEEVGMLGAVAAWLPFVQLLSFSGMDNAAYHWVAKGQPWAFVVNLFFRLRWSLVSSVLLLGGGIYWHTQGNSPLAYMFYITALSYPVTIGMTASAGMLGAQERFKRLFWYRIWESLTDFAGFLPLLLSLWWISQVVTFYATNQLATAVMQVGVSFWIVWQLKAAGTPALSRDEHQEMLSYGRHQTALMAVSTAQVRTDALLVGLLQPLETMADYSIGALVAEQFRRLWGVYVAVRYPPLVRMEPARRWRRFISEGALVWAGLIAAGIGVAILAHLLIPIILPPQSVSSLPFIDLMIATVLVGTPGGIVETYFRTRQNQRKQYQMRLVAAVVGVLAPAALVIPFGAIGAISGRMTANAIFSVIGIYFFLREGRQY